MRVSVRDLLGSVCVLLVSAAFAAAEDGTEQSQGAHLNAPAVAEAGNPGIVPGRCFSNGCWWWRILAVEPQRDTRGAKLIKVTVSTTESEYTQEEIDARGYPEAPSRFSEWDPPEELFVVCSKDLPAVIERTASGRSYSATVPFRQDGRAVGSHEGLGNLYY